MFLRVCVVAAMVSCGGMCEAGQHATAFDTSFHTVVVNPSPVVVHPSPVVVSESAPVYYAPSVHYAVPVAAVGGCLGGKCLRAVAHPLRRLRATRTSRTVVRVRTRHR